jgi:hypothetical protein
MARYTPFTPTFFWEIQSMEVIIKDGNLNDVVYNINWTLNALTEANNVPYSVNSYGSVVVPPPDPDDFTPYEDLTKDQVVGWLYLVLPVPDMEASLTRQLDAMINPTTETLPPPFPNTPSGSGSLI